MSKKRLMQFVKNEMINDTLDEYFQTWQHTQDTADFVDEKFLKKIDKYIFRDLKKKFKQIDIYDLLILKDKGVKIGFFNNLKVFFSGFKPIYEADKGVRDCIVKKKTKHKKRKSFNRKKNVIRSSS